MLNHSEEKKLHKIFIISVIIKGVDAFIEFAVGFCLIFITPNIITKFTVLLTQGELIEDPDSFLANKIVSIAHNFSVNSHNFLIYYLISHGLIKMALVGGLLRNKTWAYPLSIVVLSLFMLYQMARYVYAPSPWLLMLTLFDGFVLWLVCHEYRVRRRKAQAVL